MKIRTNRSSYELIQDLGILVNSEIADEFKFLRPTSKVDEKKLVEKLRAELSDEEIEQQVCNCRNLTLNITEDCNFRCKYCAFSGIYESVRIHNSQKMNLNTAKKAVNLFFKNLNNRKRNTKINLISIGFYGGEALLEFTLIKDIVKYANIELNRTGLSKQYDLQFRLSTNGQLLQRKDIAEFLVKNNFRIDVSLDGPKDEHDKFRVTYDKKESWETIWANLDYFYIKYPRYYSENISFLVTLHPFHNYEEVDQFFLKMPDRFDLKKLTINNVRENRLKKPLKRKWFNKESQQVSQLGNIKNSTRLDNKFSLKRITEDSKFTAMCFPGEIKYFIASTGDIYICERVKQQTPIGNVDDGLDYETIRTIQRHWNEEIIRNRCWKCPAVSICNVCIAQSEDKDGVRVDCTYKKRFQKSLVDYLTYKEDEKIKEILESKTSDKRGNSIKEYFRQL